MKLNNNKIDLSVNKSGEIYSIKYEGQEILHDGKKWWNKTYPIIWPNTSFSKEFIVGDKKYFLPKHGFWKELNWDVIYEGEQITMLSTHIGNEIFPFSIDIQNRIKILEETIVIETTFSNISNEEVSFRFGHHPAFIIDDNSKLDVKENGFAIDFNGKLTNKEVENDFLTKMKFGIDFDTVTYKDVSFTNVSFVAKGLKISIDYGDFDDLQIWRPINAKFICIEPWQGWNDYEYDSPSNPFEKIGSINILPGELTTFTVKIDIKKIN